MYKVVMGAASDSDIIVVPFSNTSHVFQVNLYNYNLLS